MGESIERLGKEDQQMFELLRLGRRVHGEEEVGGCDGFGRSSFGC